MPLALAQMTGKFPSQIYLKSNHFNFSGNTKLNSGTETFESALGLLGDGRGVRQYWDNEAFIAAP